MNENFDSNNMTAEEWEAMCLANEKPVKNPDVTKLASILRGYAKSKPINNYGGNFWGFNRNRCCKIMPEEIEALVTNNFATRLSATSFRMNKETR